MSPITVASRDAVAVKPLRDFFLRGEDAGWFTAAEVACRLGWVCDGHGDSTRVLRALGIKPECSRRNKVGRCRSHVRYDLAVRLCRALGMDPVDANV